MSWTMQMHHQKKKKFNVEFAELVGKLEKLVT